MRRLLIALGIGLLCAALAWWVPNGQGSNGVDSAQESTPTSPVASDGPVSLPGDTTQRGVVELKMSLGSDEPNGEAEPVMSPVDLGKVRPVAGALRVVSELDGEPLAGVSVRVLGAGAKGETQFDSDDRGLVRMPISPNLRCRFTHHGYMPFNVGKIGQLHGDPIEIELRPLACLYGKVTAPLPVWTPSAGMKELLPLIKQHMEMDDRVRLDVDRRFPIKAGNESNLRGVLDATRHMPDAARDIQVDGTWSLSLEIPREIDALKNLVVWQTRGNSKRMVATIPRVAPGDELETRDAWQDVHPLNLRFLSAEGGALSPELRIEFSRTNAGGIQDRISSVPLDEEGRVRGMALPAGAWTYAHLPELGPPDLGFEGSFEHSNGTEQVIRLPPGEPLTVTVAGRDRRSHSIGIARAGSQPKRAQSLRRMDELHFPFVPGDEAWQVVVLKHVRAVGKSVRPLGETRDVETQRIPLAAGQRRIEVVLDPSNK